MEIYKILDRFELMYPNDSRLSDLRRVYIDQDLASIFKLCNHEELRKAILEQNIYSIFRCIDNVQALDGDIEDFRKAVLEQNLHSIFRLLENEDLKKLILDNNVYSLWRILEEYTSSNFVYALKYIDKEQINFDEDCLSRGQLQSKLWLVEKLKECNVDLGTVFLCAGWYATLATMLFESDIKVDKIRSFDIDETCVDIAETFNKPWVMDNWKFKATTKDIMNMDYDHCCYKSTRSNGSECELVDTPNTVINTSCEHIPNFTEWYTKIPDGKLVVLQSNNYFEVDEHVNCSVDLEDFSRQIPMSSTLYEGELQLEKYMRFMKIGYK